MRQQRTLLVTAPFLGLAMLPALAEQTEHLNHGSHEAASIVSDSTVQLIQPGNGAFAAIAEIVVVLSEDPEVDWSQVDIDGLREHLVDMDQLIIGASVRSEVLTNGLRMRIATIGRSGLAASRMVPAHGPVLAQETGWFSEVTRDVSEIVWTVTSVDEGNADRIQALGFFGLMATGGHHREHHLLLARGENGH